MKASLDILLQDWSSFARAWVGSLQDVQKACLVHRLTVIDWNGVP
jgi:hypothetical protein